MSVPPQRVIFSYAQGSNPGAWRRGTLMKSKDRVEDFVSTDQNGNTVRLSELLRAGPLVLFFYPKAMTPG
jgi:peroxiredoxin Q/BCP